MNLRGNYSRSVFQCVSYVTCILCCVLFIRVGIAQENPLFFLRTSLNVEEGPNGENITALLHDSRGFLWVGTQTGLRRFDGVYSLSFEKGPAGDSTKLSDAIINTLIEHPLTGEIWIGTENGGVNILNPESLVVRSLKAEDSRIDLRRFQRIRQLSIGGESSVLIVTQDQGALRYSGKSDLLEDWGVDSSNALVLPSDSIKAILAYRSQAIIATSRGVYLLDLRRSKTYPLYQINQLLDVAGSEEVETLEKSEQDIWIGTNRGRLFRMNLSDSSAYLVKDLRQLDRGIRGLSQISISSDKEKLWIASRGGGLVSYSLQSQQFTQYRAGSPGSGGLTNNQVIAVEESGDGGVLWVGTFDGLSKSDLDGVRFSAYKTPAMPRAPCQERNSTAIMSIYEPSSEPGIIWLGTMDGGLQRYDRKNDSYDFLFTCEASPVSPIFSILENRNGQLWFGNDKSSLYLVDRKNFSFERVPISDHDGIQILQIYELPGQPGKLWLVTNSFGLLRFDSEKRVVEKRYGVGEDVSARLSSNYTWRILADPWSEHGLWVATRDKGLNWLDTLKDSVRVFNSEKTACFTSDLIFSLEADRDTSLWLGTYDGGLINFHPQSGECKNYNQSEGLPWNDIGAIMRDRYQRLWMTSTGGITLFNPNDTSFTKFTSVDGLQEGMFFYPSHYRNQYGEFFWGGMEGFHVVLPDSIQTRKNTVPVRISELLVLGKQYPVSSYGTFEIPILLEHLQHDVQFRISSPDFRRQANSRYRTRLLPLYPEWENARDGISARYAQLKPGTYTFEAIGTNADGVWNLSPTRSVFVISPPFYGTWWFWPSVILLLFLLVLGLFTYRIYYLDQDKRTRARIARDLHDKIGSSLTNQVRSVELAAREIRDELQVKSKLIKIANNERELIKVLRLIVWMVDSDFDRLPMLFERLEQFKDQMLPDFRLEFVVPESIPDIELTMLQREHILLIYTEVLHNIVRHSKAQSVSILLRIDDKYLELLIEDDGVGFDIEKNKNGSGQKNMRFRAAEIQGKLSVFSRIGEGTTVRLVAPLHPKKDWISVFTGLLKTLSVFNMKTSNS